ncbi:MAG TPA: DUF29 family protein [Oscillatoriaceae cyanobacterium M33_DOE_052]|uniref:DUF29 family protein n=1 Tax=Planktothricoides sp. SpSt-374 TaxID=2282167 RepID=A0A7C3VIP4_9CYAN|nr:DUF29 family protein [Oscillatoriaceae cyanobacterium M33_DOE_052]
MTQELIDLKTSIMAGRYDDALAIVDDLEAMSKKDILRKIKSFLLRLLVHLIKNQVEQRLTNSWAASISNSIIEIQDFNQKYTKNSYYLNPDEWDEMINSTLEAAITTASAEVLGVTLTPFKLAEIIDKTAIIATSKKLLLLTYEHSEADLPVIVRNTLAELPGGTAWRQGD